MKTSEIKAGAELYCDRSTNWRQYPGYRTMRVKVIDPVVRHYWRERGDGGKVVTTYVPHNALGKGVLCENLDNGRQVVCSVVSLRGPYAETKALVDANTKARNEAAEAERRARDEREARQSKAVERAKDYGCESAWGPYGASTVNLSIDDLNRLLDVASQAANVAWTCEGNHFDAPLPLVAALAKFTELRDDENVADLRIELEGLR